MGYAAKTWGIDVIVMKSAAPKHALTTAAAIKLVASMLARKKYPSSLEKWVCPYLEAPKNALPMVENVKVIVIAVAILPVTFTTRNVALSTENVAN